ncbi:MAG TPA: hypothetical protein VEV19_07750 [Ktedonobacteraceae bacterium]|nr:hypothetical protein [Ktedonobacteraceae bacterium]
MDIYRALNADVPLSLFIVMHQGIPKLSSEEDLRLVTSFHTNVHALADSLGDELQRWQQKQYQDQAEDMMGKLRREGLLAEKADTMLLKETLMRDYQRLGSRVGSRSLVGLLGASEVVLEETMPGDRHLSSLLLAGQRYMTSLGFRPGQGIMHETWLLFRGSVHYDIMDHLIRTRTEIYQDSPNKPFKHIRYMTTSTFDLVYQTGEGLTAEPHEDVPMQQVAFAINKGQLPYSVFRHNIAILMEDVGEHALTFHASFWQRKLGLGIGKEFVLRFRLPEGKDHLQSLIRGLSNMGPLGSEIVKQGAMTAGRRVL